MKSRFAGSKGLRVPAALFVLISIGLLRPAAGEGLSVSPINVAMAPGQMATVINLGNQGNREISFQIRAFTWQQTATDDPLSPTEELFVSPPLGTIAPGATQVARLVLRQAPREREATYRILVDELPPPAEAGSVRVASGITAQCANGAPYNIGLDAGTGPGATVATREMTQGTNTLNYSLYSDPGRRTVWGNTIGVNTVIGTGTGTVQAYTVYGRIPPQTVPGPGSYSDTIVVTLTF